MDSAIDNGEFGEAFGTNESSNWLWDISPNDLVDPIGREFESSH